MTPDEIKKAGKEFVKHMKQIDYGSESLDKFYTVQLSCLFCPVNVIKQ